jgi:hypothetical protein
MNTPFITAKPRVHRKRRLNETAAPAALTLVGAWFDDTGFLTLAFDRAIDISAMDGDAMVVNAPIVTENEYVATGPAVLEDPATVRISVVEIGPASGDAVVLTAGADNGIVAVEDGAAWAGVAELELPFP